MQHRKTVALTARDDRFIAEQIEAGEFGNASEVVRAGLRLLEQEQLRLQSLRKAIAEGDADLSEGRYVTVKRGELAKLIRETVAQQRAR